MTYAIGIDLGTTFTAAATWRDGHAEIASLGSRAAVIPSVVLLREDETVLTGETAHRRGMSEPHRVSREFKRRLGDTTPILLGGVPYSAEALMAKLLRAVVDDVTEREGGPPTAVCISHPANWGPYKKDLLTQAVRLSGLDQPVTLTTEPEAAAVFYARQQRVEPGAVVAVYDLGGGTFDAAVLRKTAAGFEILGQPEGIERLGGIDFDAAVFNHVRQALGGKLEELDDEDPTAIAAVARLRDECVAAKEALSSDTDASIPVLLPNISTEIRLTRAELESMVRPTLGSTIEALRRALRSANVTPEQIHSVLLVGGSSRLPLVGQMVGAELGRPVAVDAHPKHAVALGAAWLASGEPTTPPPASGMPPAGGPARGSSPAGAVAAGLAGAAAGGLAGAAAAGSAGSATGSARPPQGADARPTFAASASVPAAPAMRPVSPASPPPASPPPPPPPPRAPVSPAVPTSPAPRAMAGSAPVPRSATGRYDWGAAGPPPPSAPAAQVAAPGSRRRLLVVAGAALAMVLAGATVAYAVSQLDPDGGVAGPPASNPANDPETAPATTLPSQPPTEDPVPIDEQCTDEIMSNERWVCLTSATRTDGQLVLEYDVEWAGSIPETRGGYHLHIYGGDGTEPPAAVMGTQAGEHEQGSWKIRDENPAVLSAEDAAEVIGDYPKVCARIANGEHALEPDQNGGYNTGNCIPVQHG